MKSGYILLIAMILALGACKDDRDPESFQGCTGSMNILNSYDTSDVRIYAPTAFTPNADGINDLFGLWGTGFTDVSFEVEVGNSVIFLGQQPNHLWNGEINGNVYSGTFRYTGSVVTIHGDTVLVEGNAHSLIQKDPTLIENCSGCLFPDQIHPTSGFVYPTSESQSGCR